MSIRLLLDARKIFDGGVGVYTQNIIEVLVEEAEVSLSLLINPEQQALLAKHNFSWLSKVQLLTTDSKVLSFSEYFCLAKKINFKNFDLYQTPFFTLPFGIPIPAVITIHDLIQITHPEKFYYPLLAKLILKSSISRAKGVLTVSKFSAEIINKYFNCQDKLKIIPNVLSKSFATATQVKPEKIGKNFLLAIYSNLKPHKACLDLLEVFTELHSAGKLPKDSYLVLAGKGLAEPVDTKIKELIAGCSRIINLGEVSDPELVTLLQEAQALVVSSVVEGFCLPVLQAHSQGIPVITRPVLATQELITASDFVAKDFSRTALAEVITKFYLEAKPQKLTYDLSNYDLFRLSDKLTSYYKYLLSNESSVSS